MPATKKAEEKKEEAPAKAETVDESTDYGVKEAANATEEEIKASFPLGVPDESIVVKDGVLEVQIAGRYDRENALGLVRRLTKAQAETA